MARGPQGLSPQSGLGKAIRLLREETKVTQTTLAQESDVSASWLSRIEHGEVDPTWATVKRLSKGLGLSLESLAERAEQFEHMDG